MTFTVVAVYLDSAQVMVQHVEAETAAAAAGALRRLQERKDNAVAILTVFKGEHLDLWNKDELMVS